MSPGSLCSDFAFNSESDLVEVVPAPDDGIVRGPAPSVPVRTVASFSSAPPHCGETPTPTASDRDRARRGELLGIWSEPDAGSGAATTSLTTTGRSGLSCMSSSWPLLSTWSATTSRTSLLVLALCDADNVDVLQTSWEGAVIDANDVLVLVQYDVTVNGNDEISDGGVDSTGSWGTSPLAACRPRPPHRLPLCAWCGYRMF